MRPLDSPEVLAQAERMGTLSRIQLLHLERHLDAYYEGQRADNEQAARERERALSLPFALPPLSVIAVSEREMTYEEAADFTFGPA